MSSLEKVTLEGTAGGSHGDTDEELSHSSVLCETCVTTGVCKNLLLGLVKLELF